MEKYNKEIVQKFFKKFWSNPENVKRFNEGFAERARSANKMCLITTDADHECLCKELGLPLLTFRQDGTYKIERVGEDV